MVLGGLWEAGSPDPQSVTVPCDLASGHDTTEGRHTGRGKKEAQRVQEAAKAGAADGTRPEEMSLNRTPPDPGND